MSGELAGVSMISIDLIVAVVVISMIAGVVDLIRQPGWAWRSADESKLAYLVLVALVPIVGLGMYLFMARPKVVAIAKAGRAASLPFERYGDDSATKLRDDLQLPGTIAAPAGLGSFGELIEHAAPVPSLEAVAVGADPGRRTRSRRRRHRTGRTALAPHRRTRPPRRPLAASAAATVAPPAGLTRVVQPEAAHQPACDRELPHRPGGMEGRPDGSPPVPLLGRVPLDGERRGRRSPGEGRRQFVTPPALVPPAGPSSPPYPP